ncbi:hypothetical protein GTA62_18435 [Roseobacter sp. HKCCD9010]|uniref:hypothetical protein n=1 Tax=unclassified Roseobacter TaxID=196798 RepID=UPI00149150C9|nr:MULTISPECIES: hypothetical protein [unclassified Roseobacter]MBF9051897.1 hypothetical protein [Rhodobacterales bacterium HKCCD4356]NNV78633.1 hypothetical protein [Roseobacter sp. HKCCD6135]NNW04234.1 hypothetical protein [Roseobacter sp. HKCCD9022]NNW16945.1 hypothetical protein [Roseobacter sp. HKCCD8832]NNW25472.1 hypothetical protein [Roseobacter sp. HKCCD5929]NNW34041.1 hypothetical protein [Roseobacter sp. HKCCD8198]NNW51115.1 hypothetical protein [Roseobacter sp. HKCCD9144]NNW552
MKTREERRLIRAAEKEGFFRLRFKTSEIHEMVRIAIDANPNRAYSTLSTLGARRGRLARNLRADDARRKAILGAFIVAQCRHKPELHASIQEEVRAFLWCHPDKGIATANIALLAPFFEGAQQNDMVDLHPSAPGPRETEQRRKLRTRRLILLGAWVLDRYTFDPLVRRVAAELDTFLEQDVNEDRNRTLLSDVLRATRSASRAPSSLPES